MQTTRQSQLWILTIHIMLSILSHIFLAPSQSPSSVHLSLRWCKIRFYRGNRGEFGKRRRIRDLQVSILTEVGAYWYCARKYCCLVTFLWWMMKVVLGKWAKCWRWVKHWSCGWPKMAAPSGVLHVVDAGEQSTGTGDNKHGGKVLQLLKQVYHREDLVPEVIQSELQ